MSKVRFLFKSVTDDATLAATSGTPSRMQTGGAARTWRSDDLVEQTITAPLAASKNFNLVHIENINTDKVFTVQFSDDNFATIKHAETFSKWAKELTYKAATHWLTGAEGGNGLADANGDRIADANGDTLIDNTYSTSLPVSAQDMRLVVSDSTNSDGYVEIGRLMAGEYYEAESSPNISEKTSFDYKERNQQIMTRGGQPRAMDRDPQRWVKVEYEFLHEDDATEITETSLMEYLRTVGNRKNILISVYPNEGTDRERLKTIVGNITQRSPVNGDFTAIESGTPKLYSKLTFEVTEAL